MITIEEKLNLFTRIVYDKVEKENKEEINKFNNECGSIIRKKTEEFNNEARQLEEKIEKDTIKEKMKILSKAKIEGNKIIARKNNEIFNDAVGRVLEYAREYTETKEYAMMLKNDLAKAIGKVNDNSDLTLCLTAKDAERYGYELGETLNNRGMELLNDNSIIGGFIIINKEQGYKIDMSFINRIDSAKELIGERLFEILQ